MIFEGGWGPLRLVDAGGRVAGVDFRRCLSVLDPAGRFRPRYDAGERRPLKADTVIIAIGQLRSDSCLPRDRDGREPEIDPLTLQAGALPVFVAGDFATGPASAVEAMASGRAAAESLHRLLSGDDLHLGRAYRGPVETDFEIDHTRGSARDPVPVLNRPCRGKGDFRVSELPLDEPGARCEAGRCYSCGLPHGRYRTCWFCLPCEVECPEKALWVEIPYLLR